MGLLLLISLSLAAAPPQDTPAGSPSAALAAALPGTYDCVYRRRAVMRALPPESPALLTLTEDGTWSFHDGPSFGTRRYSFQMGENQIFPVLLLTSHLGEYVHHTRMTIAVDLDGRVRELVEAPASGPPPLNLQLACRRVPPSTRLPFRPLLPQIR